MTINHIALYVEDLEGEKDFFETYFGGKAGDKYHNNKTGNIPGLKKRENKLNLTGYVHIAFNTGSKENVNSLTERLRTDGFTITSEPRTTGDGYYESVIKDKEGNLIEITI